MKVMDVLIEVPMGDPTSGLLTVDDVLRMDPSGRFRIELHEGVLRMTPPPAWKHQKVAARLERHFEDSGREVCRGNGIEFNDRNWTSYSPVAAASSEVRWSMRRSGADSR